MNQPHSFNIIKAKLYLQKTFLTQFLNPLEFRPSHNLTNCSSENILQSMTPKLLPVGPNYLPNPPKGSKMTPKWLHMTPKGQKLLPNASQVILNNPEMVLNDS